MPTVDLRFVVHNTAELKQSAKNLAYINKLSIDRVKTHDAVAAAQIRAQKATKTFMAFAKELEAVEKQRNLTGRAKIDLENKHIRMLQQRRTELQEYIDTDKVLNQQAKEAKRLSDGLSKAKDKEISRVDKLRDKYDSMGAATRKYQQAQKDIEDAFRGVEGGAEKAKIAMDALEAEYREFEQAHKSGTIVNAGNQFARYGDQAYRAQQRTKRFASVGLQQAGYQVNDFIVQIASGQNALVAFGQQGSQLAGIFGTGGAIVGAVIAAAAAIGNLIYQTNMATNDTRDFGEVVDDLKDSIGDLVDSMEPLDLKDLGEQYGSMAGSMARMADSVRDLNAAIADSDFRASLEEYAKQSKGSIMSVAADMFNLADAAQRLIDISPTLLAVIAPRAYKGYASAGEEAGKAYAEDLAKGFGTGVSATDVENYFQQLLLAEQSGTAGDAARIVEEFEEKIRQSTSGFDTLTISGQRFVKKMQELREEYSQLQSAIDGSGLLQASQNRSNEASAKAIAAARKKALKLQADIAKAVAKIAKDRQKAQDKRRSKMAKALEQAANEYRQVLKREEKAIANSQVQLKQQGLKNRLLQAEVDLGKGLLSAAEYRAEQVGVAEALARITAEQKFSADGITEAEQAQIELLALAAGNAETLRQKLEESAEDLRRGKEEAKQMAQFLERAARASEIISNINLSVEDKIAVMKAKIAAAQAGGDPELAGKAVSGYLKAERTVMEQSQGVLSPEGFAKLEERKTLERELYDLAVQYKELTKSDKESGGKEKLNAIELLTKEWAEMDLNLKKREALIGLTEEEITLQNIKMQLFDKVKDKLAAMDEGSRNYHMSEIARVAEMIAAEEKRIRLLEEQRQAQKDLADTIANSMGDALTSIVDGTKSVKDAFKDMARAIIAELYQIYVVKQITGMISSAINPYLPRVPNANGNAFYGGNVIPFANGGVVGSPTTFPMSAGRTGLMGEAGPEAIMPLKRGKNGKLGVQAEGGAGDVIIHQNFNFQANGDDSVKKIIAQAAPQIAQMTKSSIISDRRRGGQMKATFG